MSDFNRTTYLIILTVLHEIDFLSIIPPNALEVVAFKLASALSDRDDTSDGSTAGPFFPEQLS